MFSLASCYYDHSFKSKGVDNGVIDKILQVVQPCVSLSMNESLVAPYIDEEIKQALFQMHPSKSPRLDGMSPFFYQKHWHVVHHDVCLAVWNFLQT